LCDVTFGQLLAIVIDIHNLFLFDSYKLSEFLFKGLSFYTLNFYLSYDITYHLFCMNHLEIRLWKICFAGYLLGGSIAAAGKHIQHGLMRLVSKDVWLLSK